MSRWIATAWLACLAGQDSLVGEKPPELEAEKGQWIGTAAPLALGELKGKVVWLEFGVLG